MALDLMSKAQIRRHLGLPAAGLPTAGYTLGVRTVTRAGQLEYYMNVLQIEEESIILGRAYDSIYLYGPVLSGQTIQATVTPTSGGGPYVTNYTVTTADQNFTNGTSQNFSAQSASLNLAIAMQATLVNTGYTAAGSLQLNPSSVGTQMPPVAQVGITGPLAPSTIPGNPPVPATFTLTVTGTATGLATAGAGSYFPYPQLVINDGNGTPANAVIAYGILPACNLLENALLGITQNLSFLDVGSTATGGAKFRPFEPKQRQQLLQLYRRQLGVYLSFYQPDPVSMISGFGIEV
jgi:hypothetical protein